MGSWQARWNSQKFDEHLFIVIIYQRNRSSEIWMFHLLWQFPMLFRKNGLTKKCPRGVWEVVSGTIRDVFRTYFGQKSIILMRGKNPQRGNLA